MQIVSKCEIACSMLPHVAYYNLCLIPAAIDSCPAGESKVVL